uniref:Uncharacterized protein n=1 Tax=Triticum urartu TaxID=4572 RepID=A0A8R7QYU8_TRIUA
GISKLQAYSSITILTERGFFRHLDTTIIRSDQTLDYH